jgi:predicted 3-demethylubiquinone-9 3-methyltransferase (glyoxalase superfamily)
MTDRPHARVCIFLKDNALQAARFYAENVPDTQIDHVQPIDNGKNMVLFRIMGTHFMAMDGNPSFVSRPDHSISIATQDQEETDRLWGALTDGGSEGRCGWLCDRFGVHWQVVPTAMAHMLGDADREAARRARAAMMTMKKIDIAAMEAAFRGNT